MTQIFTVAELTSRIRERLDTDPRLHDLWARGELSNVVNHRSGHRYFTLKDSEAQISCVLFRSQARNLNFSLRDGQNVLVFGEVDVYRPRGKVQLVARGVRLDTGVGLRHLELEALKQRLFAEGLFAPEQKRPLPKYPGRIGVVTSPDGAALRDVLRTMGPYPCRVVISPAMVQGEGAAESVARAVGALRGMADVVIVCRGGGSVEDLWPFNTEAVARAISGCDVPVISAVGHETDVTVADLAADVRAPTPTAAGGMVVPDPEELKGRLAGAEERMVRALGAAADRRRIRLDYLERGLSSKRMYSLAGERRQRLDYLSDRLASAGLEVVRRHRDRLEMASGRLSSVSPLATLERGYAIARAHGGGLLRAKDVCPGDLVDVVLSDGVLVCTVVERNIGEENIRS